MQPFKQTWTMDAEWFLAKAARNRRWEQFSPGRISSIERGDEGDTDTWYGISVFGRGSFTNDEEDLVIYAGQCKDGYACGLGVATYHNGTKVYAEHGPDGQVDGRYVDRSDEATWYVLYERRKRKDCASVYADGRCKYNGEACAPDDPRLLALIALVAPVEVLPAAPAIPPSTRRPLATKQSSDGSAGSFCPRRRWRPPWPPRCSPILHAVASGCATQTRNSRTAKHDLAVMRARTDLA
jgi:hypothetical protein